MDDQTTPTDLPAPATATPTVDLTGVVGPRRVYRLEPADPQRVGPYTLLCRLPRGGQGADVFVGRAEPSAVDGERTHPVGTPATSSLGAQANPAVAPGQLVVVKCLPASAGELTRRRFAREVENAARIRSDRVARIVDQDLAARSPYYVQEFVPGIPLDEFLAERATQRAGGLNEEELRRIAIELLRALRDAHTAKVVHRDVKPGNLIISERGVTLVDFGISRYIGEERPVGTVTTSLAGVGSKLFASPEQLQGLPLTEASDVYSWGMVIAYAATGRHPVDPDDELSPADYFTELRSGRLHLAGVPRSLSDSVTHALRFPPQRRPTVGELIRDIEQRTRWLTQPSEIPTPRTTVRDFLSADAVADVARYHLARLERWVADTATGFGAAIAVAVVLGLLVAFVLAVLWHAYV